jgi:hypothetical protein
MVTPRMAQTGVREGGSTGPMVAGDGLFDAQLLHPARTGREVVAVKRAVGGLVGVVGGCADAVQIDRLRGAQQGAANAAPSSSLVQTAERIT